MPAAPTVTQEQFAALAKLDTPSICNGLEMLDSKYRTQFWTQQPLVCAFPELPAMVGYACTATLRSTQPGKPGKENRMKYYEYITTIPAPRVVTIADLDGDRRGFGAFWGEVNSTIHQALGCLGVVTDGGVRDLHAVAPGFQFLAGRITPSHAFADVVDFGGEVNVAGMVVKSGDLIHADRHGAVMIPAGTIPDLLKAIDLISRREKVILDAAKDPKFDIHMLEKALAGASEIH